MCSGSCINEAPECTDSDVVRKLMWGWVLELEKEVPYECETLQVLAMAKNLTDPVELANRLSKAHGSISCENKLFARYSADDCSDFS